MTRVGGVSAQVSDDELHALVADGLAGHDLDGARVCLVVPDGTRHCPVPRLLDALLATIGGRAAHCEAVVALGTHTPMSDAAIAGLVGAAPGRIAERHPGLTVRNHDWADPATFVTLGTIDADRVAALSGGRLADDLAVDVPVRVNRAVVEADLVVLVGPVLPHEVVGFSGGNKYLFPGLSGPEMIDVTHWLGALISSAAIIGVPGVTPVRALIDEAAALVPTPRRALCVVTGAGDTLHAAAFATPEVAWAEAAEVAAHTHVRHLDAPVANVLSVIPPRYDDLWTAAKGF